MAGAAGTLVRGGLFGATAGVTGVTVLKGSNEGLFGIANIINGLLPSSNGGVATPPNAELVGLIAAQNERIGDLSMQVSRLHLYGGASGGGLSFMFRWSTVVVIGGTVFVLYQFGFSFNDFMYVTKKALKIAVESLDVAIQEVGMALEIAKKELTYKLGLIEEQMEDNRKSLEEKIESEVADVKDEVTKVGEDVRGVAKVQEDVQDMVQGLETQFRCLESKMEGAASQLGRANKGISLLCNAVVKEMEVGGATGEKGKSTSRMSFNNLYDELVNYTETFDAAMLRPISYFSKAFPTSLVKDTKAKPTTTPQGLQQLLLKAEEAKLE